MPQTSAATEAAAIAYGHLAETHVVENQPPPLRDYNTYQ